MSFKAGAVVVALEAQTKKFEKQIELAQKTFRNFSKVASDSLSNIGEKAADHLRGSFVKLGDKIKSVIGNVFDLGKNLALLGTGAIVGGIINAVRVAGDFETQMLRVKAISRATAEEFKLLSDQAKTLGKSTQFSASQVGEAQQFQAMAGLKVNEIISATPGILNLAAASNLELGRSADIATNIMSQFGKKADDMTNIVDVLALTVNTSNQDMEQLADAMNYLGPTAKAMGIELEEAAAITGIMASNGLQGSLGTRALGTSLTRLAKPTDKMEQVMGRLNLRAFDLKGNFVGMPDLVRQLETSMNGLTQEQRQNYLATLFGAEAIQEWNILLANGSENLQAYSDELRQSSGAAATMAETMQSGWKGAIDRMKSAWEGLMISIGETGILDLVTEGVEYLAIVLGKLGDKVELVVRPKIQAFLQELKNWFNAGGKDAIINFLQTAWSRLSAAFDSLYNVIWPRIEPILQRFGEYLGSEQFQTDLEGTANRIGDIADKMSILAQYVLDVIDYYRTFKQEAKDFLAPADSFVNARIANYQGFNAIFNRANGGTVDGRRMYEVGENNQPELLYMNKRTYLIPGNDGKVFNRNQMDQLAKMQGNTTNNSRSIVINQYGSNLDSVFTSAPLLAV